jgi:hypothetical protein
LQCQFSHTVCNTPGRSVTGTIEIQRQEGERRIMNTNSLDKQSKQHLKIYENVMFAAKICIVAIIVTLVIMAFTLV